MDDTPGSERDTCGWDGAAAGFSPGYGGPSCPDQPAPPTGSDQQPAAAAAGKARGSSRRNAWGPHSYADLITQAILSTPERRLTLAQVYEWMVANIPWFKDKGDSTSSAGWKNSVRHNLSLHTRFVKVQNEGTGKSSWWTINPDAKTGKSSRRRSPLDPTKAGGRKRGRSKKRADGAVAEVSDGSAPLGSPTEAAGFLDPQTLLYRTAGAGCDRLSPAPIGWPYTGRPQFTPDHQVSYQPDRNGYHTDRNGFHPDRNGFHPDRNGFHPDRNGFHQDRNGLNGFHPDRNGYQPDRSGYTAESNGYLTERNGYLSGEYPTERGDGYSRLEAGRQQQQQETAGAEQGLPPPYHGIPTSGYGMFCGGGAGGGFGSDARRPGSLMVGGGGGHHPSQDVTDHHTAYGIQQVASPPVGSCPMSPGGAAAAAGEGAYPAPAAGGRPPYVSSPSSAPYASFVSGPLDQRRPSSAESEPPPSQEQTPSQLMGSVMGALQPDPALSGLELDAFQGGFVCDVDNIINEELSRDGQLDFAFSQATSGGSGSGSSLSQQQRLAPGGRSISSGSETRLPPAAGVMPRWHHQLNASM